MDEFRPKLDIFVDCGYIFIEPSFTGGRATEIIHVNPEYDAQKAQNWKGMIAVQKALISR